MALRHHRREPVVRSGLGLVLLLVLVMSMGRTMAFLYPAAAVARRMGLSQPAWTGGASPSVRQLCRMAAGNEVGLEAKKKPPKVDMGKMELLCKAGPNGKALGDCPFCHFVQMVLKIKGVDYRLVPLAPHAKPDWLVEGYGGKMPCLIHDEEAYTDSSTISQYIDYFFPSEPSLICEDASLDEEIKAGTSGIFGAFAKCIKNLDKAQDAELLKAVMGELEKIDSLLKKSGGPYLAGAQLTMNDLSLAPKLYHVKVGLAHFKNTIIPPALKSLNTYIRTMTEMEAFKASSYPPDIIVWGWNNARGTVPK